MSNLKSPSAETPPKPPLRSIVVTQTTGVKVVLPYGHFLSAEVSASGGGLVLNFAMHVVAAEGSGLEALVQKLSAMRLPSLEPTPQGTAGTFTITKVLVLPRSEDMKL